MEMFTPDARDPDSAVMKAHSRKATERMAWALPKSLVSWFRGLRDMPIWREDFADRFELLADSKVPVLFIWGDDDGVVPHSEAKDLMQEIFGPAGASCILVQGGGHALILDAQDIPQVSNCAAAWFLGSQDPNWLHCLNAFSLKASRGDVAVPPAAEVVGASAV